MSWHVKLIGTRNRVMRTVLAEPNLPPKVKDVILSLLQPEDNAPNGVRVEGFGHTHEGANSHYSNIGKLEVEPFVLLDESTT